MMKIWISNKLPNLSRLGMRCLGAALAKAPTSRRTPRTRISSEVEEELQFHLDILERKYAQQGMSPSEAHAAALRRFGNLERVKMQCVEIGTRNSLLRRILKTSSILLGSAGLAIHILNSDPNIVHIGDTLIAIAIASRLLLYVRGLSPSTFFPSSKFLSVVTETAEDGSSQKKPACS